MTTGSNDEIDDTLEIFIIEADLAGSWLERHALPRQWMVWRRRLDYRRESLALLSEAIERALVEPSESLEHVCRRAVQYLGETIMNHARSFWGRDRESGHFYLRLYRLDGTTEALDLPTLTEELIRMGNAMRIGTHLEGIFDRAVRGGLPPVGGR